MSMIKFSMHRALLLSSLALATLTGGCALEAGDSGDTQSNGAELASEGDSAPNVGSSPEIVTGNEPRVQGSIDLGRSFRSGYRVLLGQIRFWVQDGTLYGAGAGTIYNESSDHSFFSVAVTSGTNVIRIVLRRNDLYVQGYEAGGAYYYFTDAEFRRRDIPNHSLGYGGSYVALENASGTTRTQIRLGQYGMRDWVTTLADSHPAFAARATALLGFVISLSEASRFRQIGDELLDGRTSLTTQEGTELNQWAALSRWVRAWLNNAGGNPFRFGENNIVTPGEAAAYLFIAKR